MPLLKQLKPLTGGVFINSHKSVTAETAYQFIPTPPQLIYHLHNKYLQYLPKVVVGEQIQAQQVIATALTETQAVSSNLHAALSGQVIEITQQRIIIAVSSEPDLSPQNYAFDDYKPALLDHETSSHNLLEREQAALQKIRQAGIIGLGGAGFPSASKLNRHLHTLVVNGVECEPYITADAALMVAEPGNILLGVIELLKIYPQLNSIYIAIEDNKPQSIKAIQTALAQLSLKTQYAQCVHKIQLTAIKTVYPAGGERQLIEQLTGRALKIRQPASDIGIACLNIASIAAIGQALAFGRPLTHRVVTLTGNALTQPGNYYLPIGTSFGVALTAAGLNSQKLHQVINGGGLMGQAVDMNKLDSIGVEATTHCIIAATATEFAKPNERPCIQCDACVPVCPEHLLPQKLFQTNDYSLACIECRACEVVCPSYIPLVDYFTAAKQQDRTQFIKQQRAEQAKKRYDARKQRLAQIARKQAAVAVTIQQSTAIKPNQSKQPTLRQLKTQVNKSKNLLRQAQAAYLQLQKNQASTAESLQQAQHRVETSQFKVDQAEQALSKASQAK